MSVGKEDENGGLISQHCGVLPIVAYVLLNQKGMFHDILAKEALSGTFVEYKLQKFGVMLEEFCQQWSGFD